MISTLLALIIPPILIVLAFELAAFVGYGRFISGSELPRIQYDVGEMVGDSRFGKEMLFVTRSWKGSLVFVAKTSPTPLSNYYIERTDGKTFRVLRFSKLHKIIEQKFKEEYEY